jgi:hypothetical protein
MDCKQNSYKGETESVESGKDNGPLLAWIDSGCGHVVNEICWARHRAEPNRIKSERETLASSQRNPKDKGKDLSHATETTP